MTETADSFVKGPPRKGGIVHITRHCAGIISQDRETAAVRRWVFGPARARLVKLYLHFSVSYACESCSKPRHTKTDVQRLHLLSANTHHFNIYNTDAAKVSFVGVLQYACYLDFVISPIDRLLSPHLWDSRCLLR